MLSIALQGFVFGLSLIVAIGAQNAFVLKQGLKGNHVFLVCLFCAASDAILIAIGVYGLHIVQQYVPEVSLYAKYVGAVFLFFYGLRSFISAFQKQDVLKPDERSTQPLWPTILVCAALTWLNPHVYLDTVVLLGSIATQYSHGTVYFASGAILASFVFFFSLGFGATRLRPLFRQPLTWKILDVAIGLVMWSIAYSLVFSLNVAL
ncbi:MAG: LysE/ArgO family amino acid transporter [Arenicella sp.]